MDAALLGVLVRAMLRSDRVIKLMAAALRERWNNLRERAPPMVAQAHREETRADEDRDEKWGRSGSIRIIPVLLTPSQACCKANGTALNIRRYRNLGKDSSLIFYLAGARRLHPASLISFCSFETSPVVNFLSLYILTSSL